MLKVYILILLIPLQIFAVQISITIDISSGGSLNLNVEHDEKVSNVKKLIDTQIGVKPHEQILLLNGLELGGGNKRLDDYGITDGDTLNLLLSDEDLVPGIDGSAQGDGNGDGTLDSAQDYVLSKQFKINGTDQWVTVAAPDSGTTLIAVTYKSNTNNLIPDNLVAPIGKYSIDINDINGGAGTTQVITLIIPYSAVVDRLYKLNNATGNYDLIPSTVTHYPGDNKTKIVYSVTDGGTYDQDNVANAIIEDPVIPAGPVVSTVTVPISYNTYIMLILFISFIGIFKTKSLKNFNG